MNSEIGLIIDCFCGGGGATEGIEQALGRPVDIGINHDAEALRLHAVNHPETLHLKEDIFSVDLEKYVAGRPVALMWASPDCTQFSKAKGGQPREHGIRILPWAVHKHASKIKPLLIFMENVAEIQSWGDLDENGRPVEKYKGREYMRFMKAMQDLGYKYETWELVAADYGAPTTRKRWYAVFRRDGKPIVYPEPTHSKEPTLFENTLPWVPVSTVLDFEDTGESIFGRKKPLAEKTMTRIAKGIEKFVLNNPKPFIVTVNHGGDNFRGQTIDEPLSTVTSHHGYGIVTPTLIQYHSETTNEARAQAVNQPISTLDTPNRYGLVLPFLTKFYKSGTGQDVKEPIHTITTSPGHFGMVSPYLLPYYGSETDAESVNDPLRTITTKDRFSMVSAFLTRYYGAANGQIQAQGVDSPLGTVTTRERFSLVTVEIDGETYAIEDIRMRMLKPEELKLAQGFPKSYVIDHDSEGNAISKKEQVAKIGNSVVPAMAKALVLANCPEFVMA